MGIVTTAPAEPVTKPAPKKVDVGGQVTKSIIEVGWPVVGMLEDLMSGYFDATNREHPITGPMMLTSELLGGVGIGLPPLPPAADSDEADRPATAIGFN